MSYYFLLVYIFFFFIRLQDWWAPLLGFPVDDVVISIILVSIIPSVSKIKEVIKLPQSKFVLLFLITVFLSNVVNGHIDDAYTYGIKYLKFMTIFFVVMISVDSFSKLKMLPPFIILLITFIAFQCLIQAKTGTNWAGQSLYWLDRVRWVGVFDGSNITALAFVFVVPFFLEFIFGPWKMGYKIMSIACGSIVMTAFYLADSRGGFLSLIVVVFAFLYTRLKYKKGIIIGLILVVGLFLVAAPSRMSEIDDKDKSTRGRIHEWEEALQMVRYHNPVFGVGKGHFTDYTSLVAHNAFLEQLGETGLVGAFFWLGMVYASIVGMRKVARKEDLDPVKRSLYRAHIIGVVGLLAGVSFISADFELLYIWMALLAAIVLIERIELRFTPKHLMFIGGIEITAIIVTYITVNLFKAVYS